VVDDSACSNGWKSFSVFLEGYANARVLNAEMNRVRFLGFLLAAHEDVHVALLCELDRIPG
jgi:hypothetical protein